MEYHESLHKYYKHYAVMVGDNWEKADKDLFDTNDIHLSSQTDMPGLLKELGIYKSTSEAIRMGRRGTVPSGWTEGFEAGKRVRIDIWNPSNNTDTGE